MGTDGRSLQDTVVLRGGDGYATALTRAGAGGSRWNGLAVTRWRPAAPDGDGGVYAYVRDATTGRAWSATAAPCGGTTRTWFDAALARFARGDGAITTTLEIAADPEAAVEVRGIAVHNADDRAHRLALTSCAEVALAPAAADAAHPAYSKMFVQTAQEKGVLLAWRRKKDPAEPDAWAAHALVVDGAEAAPREWETDRARFIGRDRRLAAPVAQDRDARLSGTTGTVLDPVFSLRATLSVPAGGTRRAAWVTAVAASREAALALVQRYLTPASCEDVFARARRAARHDADADVPQARAFQRLTGAVLGVDSGWREPPVGDGGAPVLWAKGISGDLPIVLVRVRDAAHVQLVEDLVRAQRYWRALQLPADVVVVGTATGAERARLDATLQDFARAAGVGDKAHGSLFVLHADELDPRLRDGLATAACVVLDARHGGLAAQLARSGARIDGAALRLPGGTATRARGGVPSATPKPNELEFWNGLGGFTRDGREYVTVLRDGASTPAPWSHLVANPDFGFLVTASGGGYSWALNSQQNQITPWSNDAVCDPPGQSFLLRDMDTGNAWGATAAPIRIAGATYVARFGPGYARFDASADDVESELTLCVAPTDPVQLAHLVLRNRSARTRHLEVAQVVAWALGAIGRDANATTKLEADLSRGAVFARNAWREEFAGAVAFIACGAPSAVSRSEGSTRSAVVAPIELAPGAQAELTFLLGEGADRAAAVALVDRYRATRFEAALKATHETWDRVLGPLRVKTPQRSLDLLVNRCLPYQVLACRVWARTAFYQASGAFGFRDQLQDVAALCLTRPDLARQHLLLAASRQFGAGDAQHWWLPPSGRGVRTRIVDDRLWLPYVVAHYVRSTGDAGVLDEAVPFLRGDPLPPHQNDSFFQPQATAQAGSLFEHCARAIEASLATGTHGLPLMGTGDWNDGMNRVGERGRGESVWMAWFLIDVVNAFAPIAERRQDVRAARWRGKVWDLQHAVETAAWDGAWYRRAFYDDGAPLGTAADAECQIESMAQSWAVISGAGDPERARAAMRAVDARLVRPDDGVVALFWPPFDRTPRDPGYIKGYPPGLRENGGQYTHGSIWSLIAFALLGQGDRAAALLDIFNPIAKSDSPDKVARYQVEPYVECADVYSVAPHAGRGGWTWYSGSGGWLYRAIVEWVLGLRPRGDRLHVDPCIPHAWEGFRITWRRGATTWDIEVRNPGHVCRGVAAAEVDGVKSPDLHAGIALVTDGAAHHVRITLQQGSSDAHRQV